MTDIAAHDRSANQNFGIVFFNDPVYNNGFWQMQISFKPVLKGDQVARNIILMIFLRKTYF